MSTQPVMAVLPPAAESARQEPASPAAEETAGTAPPPAAEETAGTAPPPGGWWRAWRDRFGLAELCGTLAAVAGFAAGYLATGSLLVAAGLATAGEATGFYGCVGVKTAAAARRATAHLTGFRRLAAGAWHAVTRQLASCAAAEVLDGFLIRPGSMAGAAWLFQPLPGGVWLGFVIGKVAADVVWYGFEAAARRGVAWSLAAGAPAKPEPRGGEPAEATASAGSSAGLARLA